MRTIEYTVASHYMPAIINDDYSGMSDHDEMLLNDFLDSEQEHNGMGHWTIKDNDEESNFTSCEVCSLMADCSSLVFVIM